MMSHVASMLGALSFRHPESAGAGIILALVPIIVHYLNRRRYVRIPWAAMRFLLAASERNARRLRLEQWLLLLIRVAVMLLICLAIARPLLSKNPLMTLGSDNVHRVVLLDNSLSMNAIDGQGVSRFERARRASRKLVESFPPSDVVTVIAMAKPARLVTAQGTMDHAGVLEQIKNIQATHLSGDPEGAIDLAALTFDQSDYPPSDRVVYLVSDFLCNDWGSSNPTRSNSNNSSKPAITAVKRLFEKLDDPSRRFVVVPSASHDGQGDSRNTALTSFGVDASLMRINSPSHLTATVSNLGPVEHVGATLELLENGQVLDQKPLASLSPGQSQRVTLSMVFGQPGIHVLEARLVNLHDDCLAEDNNRFLSLEVRNEIPVLLVDGKPGVTPFSGAAGFLATALSPNSGKTGGVLLDPDATPLSPTVITVQGLDLLGQEELSNYAVVALCNVGYLSDANWSSISEFVRQGGGLLICAGDQVTGEHYNRLATPDSITALESTAAAETAGESKEPKQALLPGVIIRRNGVFASSDEPGSPNVNTAVRFSPDIVPHPIVNDFNALPTSGLFTARVDEYLGVEPDTSRTEIVLRYSDGAPALMVSPFGRGRAAFYTTTANLEWNNLPARGDYVSLMLNAFGYITKRFGGHRTLWVGDTLVEPIEAAKISLAVTVVTPDGQSNPARVSLGPSGMVMEYSPLESVGVYEMTVGTDARGFAVNTPPEESSLTTIEPGAMRTILGTNIRVIANPDDLGDQVLAGGSIELSRLTFVMLLILLLVEMVVASSFGVTKNEKQISVTRHRATAALGSGTLGAIR